LARFFASAALSQSEDRNDKQKTGFFDSIIKGRRAARSPTSPAVPQKADIAPEPCGIAKKVRREAAS
jgi:hypothetical protein